MSRQPDLLIKSRITNEILLSIKESLKKVRLDAKSQRLFIYLDVLTGRGITVYRKRALPPDNQSRSKNVAMDIIKLFILQSILP